jgi:hypothetical protein
VGKKVATLSLGDRKDAGAWEDGCRRMGYQVVVSVRSPNPSDDELREFFKCDAEWLFFGGHFNLNTLYNHARQERRPGGLAVQFTDEDVRVFRDEVFQFRLIKTGGFRLHHSAGLLLWGGCSTLSSAGTVLTMRKLFGGHTALGFTGKTEWEIVNNLLGAGTIQPNHFFRQYWPHAAESFPNDGLWARRAWMEAARIGYGGQAIEGRFRAVDFDGQSWKLAGGKIVPGGYWL